MSILNLIGRDKNLFDSDINFYNEQLSSCINKSKFLVIGGAGSIGQAVVKELFKRNPLLLHVVDISENNLVELVRDIRSNFGYIDGDFQTYAIDCGSIEFEALMRSGVDYDYVLNLSALKHVRSEQDPYTLMRLIDVNIFNTMHSIRLASNMGAKKYFCVSTDKAANPVNMMGASKRIMEMFIANQNNTIPISTARFANVAFSDGSLLHGFNQRILKRQPISAPYDIKRYFVTPQESGELCLMSCLLGLNGDIFFPKLSKDLHLITFSDIATKFLNNLGYEVEICKTEAEAREKSESLIADKKWPCYFFKSDTTGEKDFEEFFTPNENIDMNTFNNIGVIKNNFNNDIAKLQFFISEIEKIKNKKIWEKEEIINIFKDVIPEFYHKETGKYLNERM